LAFLSSVLLGALAEPTPTPTEARLAPPEATDTRNPLPGVDGDTLLTLFDSMVTFQSHFAQRRDWAALIDALVLDRDNPRALAWVVHTLRGRMARLDGREQGDMGGLASGLPHPGGWAQQLRQPSLMDSTHAADTRAAPLCRLAELLDSLRQQAWGLSESVSTAYFTHVHTGRLTQ
jgi:uncharacterized alpha-E superfamily protein